MLNYTFSYEWFPWAVGVLRSNIFLNLDDYKFCYEWLHFPLDCGCLMIQHHFFLYLDDCKFWYDWFSSAVGVLWFDTIFSLLGGLQVFIWVVPLGCGCLMIWHHFFFTWMIASFYMSGSPGLWVSCDLTPFFFTWMITSFDMSGSPGPWVSYDLADTIFSLLGWLQVFLWVVPLGCGCLMIWHHSFFTWMITSFYMSGSPGLCVSL